MVIFIFCVLARALKRLKISNCESKFVTIFNQFFAIFQNYIFAAPSFAGILKIETEAHSSFELNSGFV